MLIARRTALSVPLTWHWQPPVVDGRGSDATSRPLLFRHPRSDMGMADLGTNRGNPGELQHVISQVNAVSALWPGSRRGFKSLRHRQSSQRDRR
jgi:hypothetical protein